MLKQRKGNLIDMAEAGDFNVIVQGCNCHCAMGSGIAKEIRARYPEAYYADTKTVPGDYNKLGTFSIMLGKQFNIVNAYTQYNTAKYVGDDVFEYGAFELILKKLAHQRYTGGARFGFPKIGQGLAGGNPEIIMEMLQDFATKVSVHGSTVTVVEFKLK